MKQTYSIPVRLSDELMRKLLYVSEAEGRTPNNQFTFMLRNNIQYFEKVHGKISPATLAKYDLTPTPRLRKQNPNNRKRRNPIND